MPLINPYRYALLLCRQAPSSDPADGSTSRSAAERSTIGAARSGPASGPEPTAHVLGQVPVDVDWEPAVEWARFQALRRDADPDPKARESAPMPIETSIAPIWDDKSERPYIRGFRIAVPGESGEPISTEFPAVYFRRLAKEASGQFVDSGALLEGERYVYMPLAFPAESIPEATGTAASFSTELTRSRVRLRPGQLAGFSAGGGLNRASAPGSSADHPVFVEEQVLDEALQIARSAAGKEAGGILIGHLRRDPGTAEVFAHVTAQIPARHTNADAVSLTFTADTWSDVRAALALRGRDEMMLGWFHSHPVREWCSDCPLERQKQCALAKDFFSAQDRVLHRTVFSAAHSVALVINDVAFAADMSFSMFGWREGLIEPRDFHSINRAGRIRRDAADRADRMMRDANEGTNRMMRDANEGTNRMMRDAAGEADPMNHDAPRKTAPAARPPASPKG